MSTNAERRPAGQTDAPDSGTAQAVWKASLWCWLLAESFRPPVQK
jgi:hypothetical protein